MSPRASTSLGPSQGKYGLTNVAVCAVAKDDEADRVRHVNGCVVRFPAPWSHIETISILHDSKTWPRTPGSPCNVILVSSQPKSAHVGLEDRRVPHVARLEPHRRTGDEGDERRNTEEDLEEDSRESGRHHGRERYDEFEGFCFVDWKSRMQMGVSCCWGASPSHALQVECILLAILDGGWSTILECTSGNGHGVSAP